MSEPKFYDSTEGPVLVWEDEEGVKHLARPTRMSQCVRCGGLEPYRGANHFICLHCNEKELYGLEVPNSTIRLLEPQPHTQEGN